MIYLWLLDFPSFFKLLKLCQDFEGGFGLGVLFICPGFLVSFCNVIHGTYFFRLEWLKIESKMVKKTFEVYIL